MKVGNLDCTFCLDCVYACPHGNVGLVGRMPGAELSADAPRSGVGRPSRREDWAALAVVFTFGRCSTRSEWSAPPTSSRRG